MYPLHDISSLDEHMIREIPPTPVEWLSFTSRMGVEMPLAVPVFPSLLDKKKTITQASSSSRPITSNPASTKTSADVPVISHQKGPTSSDGNASQIVTKRPLLLALHAEFIEAIYGELALEDALGLITADPRFWKLGWPLVDKKLEELLAHWDGSRIVYAGEAPPLPDFRRLGFEDEKDEADPPRTLSEDQKKEIAEDLNADELGPNDKRKRGIPVDVSEISYWKFCKLHADGSSPRLLHDLRDIALYKVRQARNLPVSKKASFLHLTKSKELVAKDKRSVELDMTGWERSRSRALNYKNKFLGLSIEHLRFHTIQLERISWSSKSYLATFTGESYQNGIWAGHLFEISRFSDYDLSTQPDHDEIWKPISSVAITDMRGFWDSAIYKVMDKQFERIDRMQEAGIKTTPPDRPPQW